MPSPLVLIDVFRSELLSSFVSLFEDAMDKIISLLGTF
jgi:hypothetical protein